MQNQNTHRTLKIVIIEDSPELAVSFEEIFAVEGHQVKIFLTGAQALQSEHSIREADVLLSDYYLPDMNGMEVITQARIIHPNLPVVLLSGAREPAVLASLKLMPQALFLPKPIDIFELEQQVYKLVG